MPYDAIYPYIRTRLQDSIVGIEDSVFDPEIAAVLRKLLTPYGKTFEELTGVDLDFVNEAAGLMTAARLITPYSTGGANSDLTAEKTETQSRSFATNASEKDRWIKEAKEAMSQVSFVAAMTPSGPRFGRGGYRRTQEQTRECDC